MENQETAIVRAPETRPEIIDLTPEVTRRKLEAIRRFQAIVRNELKDGHDYGTIPGCGDKPTLLKPGAEKIAKLLNCFDDYEIVSREENWDKPFFRYLIRCTLIEMVSGTKVSSGLGEANSYETKYRFRWVREDQIPMGLDKGSLKSRGGVQSVFEFDFAIEKRETGGKYGKPSDYWDRFDKAVQDGSSRRVMKKTKSGKEYPGHEIDVDTTLYQVPNPEIFDQVNTLLKMAKKRALVDATLSAGRLSDLFTQDLEDIADAAPIVTTVKPPAPQAEKKAEPQPAAAAPGNDDDAGDWLEDHASLEQLTEISKHVNLLKKSGETESDVYAKIAENLKKTYGTEAGDMSELTPDQADRVIAFLKVWKMKSEQKKGGSK